MSLKNKPLISISCITFNHDKYLKRCLEGMILQKTNFDFEILIHDDASKDETVSIINEFKEKFPELIFPIIQSKNQYSLGARGIMTRFNFSRARGKYIALCEGDDYWTDENKLQKQFDFMEANPDYSCVFHDSIIVDENNNYLSDFSKHRPKNPIPEKDIIAKGGNLASTASMFFRNYNEYPDFLKNAKSGDRALRLFLMTKGKFHFIDKKMCVYRKHLFGLTKGGDKTVRISFIESNIELLNSFNIYSNGKYKKYIKKELSIMAKNYAYFTKIIFNKYTIYLTFVDFLKVIIYKFVK